VRAARRERYNPPVPWLQIKLTATREQAPRLIEALEASGALSVSIEDAHDERMLQAALEAMPLWSENQVIGLFPESTDVARVLHQVEISFGADIPSPRVDVLPDADWTRAWMARYRPLAVGRGLWICPSWCAPVDPGAVNVILDPGLAFGTGAHPTTRLCLQFLQEVERGSLLDVGCGSGVLAIAGARLGFEPVLALDVDPVAVETTRANAEENGVTIEAAVVDALAETLPAARLAVANVLLRPVETILGRLESPEAITSGYLAGERPAHPGWSHVESLERDGWAADRFRRA